MLDRENEFVFPFNEDVILKGNHYSRFVHSNNPKYWIEETNQDAIFNGKIMRLINVCWCRPCAFLDIEKSGVYNLYIRHGLVNKSNYIR